MKVGISDHALRRLRERIPEAADQEDGWCVARLSRAVRAFAFPKRFPATGVAVDLKLLGVECHLIVVRADRRDGKSRDHLTVATLVRGPSPKARGKRTGRGGRSLPGSLPGSHRHNAKTKAHRRRRQRLGEEGGDPCSA